VREKNTLSLRGLIWPVFVRSGDGHERAGALYARCLSSSTTSWVSMARFARPRNLGIGAMCIFPLHRIEDRTEEAAGAWDPPKTNANRAIRDDPQVLCRIVIMTDVALGYLIISTVTMALFEDGIIVKIVRRRALLKMSLAQAECEARISIGPFGYDGRAYRRDPRRP